MSTVAIIITFIIFFITGYSAGLLKRKPDPEADRIKQVYEHLRDTSGFANAQTKAIHYSFKLPESDIVTDLLCLPKDTSDTLANLCNLYLALGNKDRRQLLNKVGVSRLNNIPDDYSALKLQRDYKKQSRLFTGENKKGDQL